MLGNSELIRKWHSSSFPVLHNDGSVGISVQLMRINWKWLSVESILIQKVKAVQKCQDC